MSTPGSAPGIAPGIAAALTLGPLLFNWPAERRRDFYFSIADEAPVETVHLGEAVCVKRAPFFDPHLPEVIERLQRGGKEVVLSTPMLVATDADMATTRSLTEFDELMVEVNDLAALSLVEGRAFMVGPTINVYNESTLAYLAARGAVRVCLPFELPATSIDILAALPVETEVQVFGRTPLAISARCYHARAHGLTKDGCQYVCDRDANGMAVETLDGDSFLAVNGTQTLSHTYVDLIGELHSLAASGVGRFRLSPHNIDMVAVAKSIRGVLDGERDAADARAAIASLLPDAAFSNGFLHGAHGDAMVEVLN